MLIAVALVDRMPRICSRAYSSEDAGEAARNASNGPLMCLGQMASSAGSSVVMTARTIVLLMGWRECWSAVGR